MILRFAPLLLALALAAWSSSAAAGAAVRYVHAGRLVDPETGRVLNNQLIRIEGDRVASVTPWTAAPTDGPVTDWSRYEVLPGLIDMHVHLADTEETSNVAEPLLHSEAEIALLGARHARETLRAGFTSVH